MLFSCTDALLLDVRSAVRRTSPSPRLRRSSSPSRIADRDSAFSLSARVFEMFVRCCIPTNLSQSAKRVARSSLCLASASLGGDPQPILGRPISLFTPPRIVKCRLLTLLNHSSVLTDPNTNAAVLSFTPKPLGDLQAFHTSSGILPWLQLSEILNCISWGFLALSHIECLLLVNLFFCVDSGPVPGAASCITAFRRLLR